MSKEVTTDFGYEITQRFLVAVDSIIGNKASGRVTQESVGTIIGMLGSNINRLRKDPERRVTVEACGRLCHHYNVSSFWLLTGRGDVFGNDELISAYKSLELRIGEAEKASVGIADSLKIIRKSIRKKR